MVVLSKKVLFPNKFEMAQDHQSCLFFQCAVFLFASTIMEKTNLRKVFHLCILRYAIVPRLTLYLITEVTE